MERDSGVEDKRLPVVETEFSSALRVMGREGNILSPMLRQAWDSVPLRILNKNSPVHATDTHLSLVSHITRSELLRYLNTTECASGFGNRFLWGCVVRSKLLPEGGSLRPDALDVVLEQVRQALEFSKTPQEIGRDAEARKMWLKAYPALTADRPGASGQHLGTGGSANDALGTHLYLAGLQPTDSAATPRSRSGGDGFRYSVCGMDFLEGPPPRSSLRRTGPGSHQTIQAKAHCQDDPATPKSRLSS